MNSRELLAVDGWCGGGSVFFCRVTSPALLMFQRTALYLCTHMQSLTGLSG